MGKPHTPSSLFTALLLFALLLGICSRFGFLYIANDALTFTGLLRSFSRGFLFDSAVALYLFLPIAALGLLPPSIWKQRWLQVSSFSLFYFITALLAWFSFSEMFFIEEFNSRFNFIAVDYLVYTNEVLGNIWESYPVIWIVPLFLIGHFAIVRILLRQTTVFKMAPRLISGAALSVAAIGIVLLSENAVLEGMDSIEAEVAKNPLHALFAAYRNNEINFMRFYSSIETSRAAHVVHEAFEADIPGFSENEDQNEDETSIVRNIVKSGPEKKMNVVIVLMESMSARYMRAFGASEDLTPNLDRLAKEGLFFDRVYSTGTRTVRGIEAVILSIPPTPGQSIVRRPDADATFNIGSVFRDRGYQTQFLYGGRSFFDNMGAFFSSNGFEVLDQSNMGPEDVHFSNAWGVADEDLFRFALKQADRVSTKPFFQFILTTSNHRPYTYPEGRIDIPPHSGRRGAVKYSDYAVGKYLEEARAKPWFKSTVFVFVADHNASVAGGTRILPSDYRIPLIYYSPGNLPARKSSVLGSQIDTSPTLLGLLNFSYQSRFFGHDLLHSQTERAFLATYQVVGLWQHNRMVLLSPTRKIDVYDIANEVPTLNSSFTANAGQKFTDPDIEDTVGFFEAASDWFGEKLLKEDKRSNVKANLRIF